MSYGFAARSCFEIVGAIDAEQGKPTLRNLDCNLTYEANIGVRPDSLDLTEYSPTEYRRIMDVRHGRPFSLDVLIACAPCTGFSQVLPKNRKRDHPKNSLVERCALWVEEFRPQVFVMENLPEMVGGKFQRHFAALERRLKSIGYGGTPNVFDFCSLGLPQRRERVIVIFTRKGLPQLSLNDFWRTRSVLPEAVTVRRAIRHLLSRSTSGGRNGDPVHQSPANTPAVLDLVRAIPHDGGSWTDLVGTKAEGNLIPCMLRRIRSGDVASYTDVYSRMAWDQPAPTHEPKVVVK